MSSTHSSDPVELRVLSALTSGAAAAWAVAAQVGEPESVVAPILERAVAEQAAVRFDLAGSTTYSLTPTGLELVGVRPDVPLSVSDAGPIDVQTPAPVPMEQPEAVADVAPANTLPPQADRLVADATSDPAVAKVRWRHVLYAAGYVVVGLFLLMLQPVLGLVAVLAGLALGGYTLRPLWRSGSRVTTR